jgi:putative redox protein
MASLVNVTFNKENEGLLQSEHSETKLSYTGKGFSPYELFLGGYASCLHATFLGIINKRRITVTEVSYEVEAFKRDEAPTIINKLITNIVIEGADEKKYDAIKKSMKQAETYCSISETINRLDAEMILNIKFK